MVDRVTAFTAAPLTDEARAATSPRRAPWQTLLGAGAIVLMIVATYAPVWHAGFIWDDEANVIDNTTLRSVDGLRQMWLVPRSIQQYYPLMYTTYWVEYQLWGLQPLGYHLVNISLHAVAALLVWRLLVRLKVPGAWFAAAIFAVHPVEVESVAWVTERKNVLSLSLALLSMLAYFRFAPLAPLQSEQTPTARRCAWYAAAFALFALALFAKTVVVTLPAVLLVIYWWKRGTVSPKVVLALVPFFALSVVMGLVTKYMETDHVGAYGEEWNLSPTARLLLAGRSLWFYVEKLVWPAPLAFFYPRFALDTYVWWQYLFPLAAIVAPLGLLAGRARLGRGPAAAALIYAGVMLPMLGFFNIYYMRFAQVSDHFQYHASVALIALAAAGFAILFERLAPAGRNFATVGATGLLFVLAVLSYRQTFIYHDLDTLYRDTIIKNPSGWAAYANLSSHVDSLGRHNEALDLAREALRLNPSEPNVHNNIGVFLFNDALRRGSPSAQIDEAIAHLRDTLQIDPERIEARKNLARALIVTGHTDEAIEEFSAALHTNPHLADIHFDLANALVGRDQLPAAAQHYEEAVRLQPGYVEALQNLGAVYFKMGAPARAIPYFEQVLRIQPDNAAARANLEQASAVIHGPMP
ncbi:MAG TPA: tetratricopeptide repeat protein [Pirellulales bacterium]|jgi:Tfp pilus assembly protein PilF